MSHVQTKPCTVCGVQIPAKATYCKECGHYQSLFGQFFGKLDATSLIAVFSTSAIIFKFLNVTLFTPPLAISAYAAECGPSKFILVFSNQGKRPGIVHGVEASRYYKSDGKPDDLDQSIPLRSESSPLIEGGGSKFTRLSFVPAPQREFSAERSEVGLKTCYNVSYRVDEFGAPVSQRSPVSVPCECF